ncbi:hypothetical protein CTAYLR_001227 [Chrysophaeum taylorii]|uniref:F-box domain-containing protein n=1 Tax=Chrysophaeum taylorii TaxID=2483200 RepID=A0AAD7UCU0_9STRA|nr:hypothetical protein CTAYLR_001227 [Chrysophaeum taylorii]
MFETTSPGGDQGPRARRRGETSVLGRMALGDEYEDLVRPLFMRVRWARLGALRCVCRRFRDIINSERFMRLRSKGGWAEEVIFSTGATAAGDTERPTSMQALVEGRWRILAALPAQLGLHAVAECGGELLITGSNSSAGVFDPTVHIYSAATNSWRRNGAVHAAFSSCRSCAVIEQTKMMCIGTGLNTGDDFVVESATFEPSTNTWTLLPRMPRCVFASACTSVDDARFFVAGGIIAGATTVDILQVYDSTTNAWSIKSPIPLALSFGGPVVAKGKFYVVGGRDGACQPLRSLFAFDLANETWEQGPDIPDQGPSGRCAVGLRGEDEILVLGLAGGRHATFDLHAQTWSLLDATDVLSQRTFATSLPHFSRK